MQIIDLFSGAGGLTEGFRKEFKIIKHVEKENAACETLRLRDSFYYFSNHNMIDKYYDFLKGKISEKKIYSVVPEKILKKTLNIEINNKNIQSIFHEIDQELNRKENITGIIGGPPCQAYSTIGRSRNASKKSKDKRIYLYKYYIRFLKKYKPTFFVFENVKGLLSFRDTNNELLFPKIQKEFEQAGYNLEFRVINAADFGVPQMRERIIIFGAKKIYSRLPQTFFKNFEAMKEKSLTVKEAFTGLPKLNAGQTNNMYTNKVSDIEKKYYRKNNEIQLTQNISRPNNANDLKIYKIVAEAKQKGINLRYDELKKELITHKNTREFLDRYKALPWDGPSHTIVAHIAKDGNHYIHPDVTQNRSITVREAARIQGFPDDYFFENSRTAAYTQIGNAVPPMLSKKIAKAVFISLKQFSL